VSKRGISRYHVYRYTTRWTRRGRERRGFRGRFNIDYCPMRARRARHQTNPFARKIPSFTSTFLSTYLEPFAEKTNIH